MAETTPMRALIGRFLQDRSGASAIEYAFIAGIIALGIVASLPPIRDGLNNIFTNTSDGLNQ